MMNLRNSAANQISDTLPSEALRIDTHLLIPGRGNPITNGTIIYSRPQKISTADTKSVILFAGATTDLPQRYLDLTASSKVPVLMPGLWDCHVHFFGIADSNVDHMALLPPALAGMRSARDVMATLNAGYTSVREVGGYGIDIKLAIEEGWIPGPRIYSSGGLISQTAGHGDLHSMPLSLIQECVQHKGLPLYLADGVDESIKAVRTQIRRGATVIKVCCTGGVMTLIDSPRAAQFSLAELEAIVEEAARANMVVAAHAHGTEGIIAALKAGVTTIEHGSYLTPQAIELMLEKKAVLVATRWIIENGLRNRHNMRESSFKKLLEIANENKKSYQAAIKAGVKCALGTDLGISTSASNFTHGMNGEEFALAVDAGMTPLQAIEAGTANGPDTLGVPPTENPLSQAPLSGQLKPGYDADFIALSENPLERIAVLAEVEKVTHVWKGGRLMKAPGQAVGFSDNEVTV